MSSALKSLPDIGLVRIKDKEKSRYGGTGCDCTTALLKKEHIEIYFIFPLISS